MLTDFPADDFDEADLGWFIEPKDRDPAPEFNRQVRFLGMLHTIAPSISATAIPNSAKISDWQRIRRWREGAVAGALDLDLTWKPTSPGDRGVFFAEFKDGQGMPSPEQRRRLNTLVRQGHRCGVYRKPETLIAHLRAAGAPFL